MSSRQLLPLAIAGNAFTFLAIYFQWKLFSMMTDKRRVIPVNDKKYVLEEKKLGEGAFGEVYKAIEETTNKEYAAKFIDKSELRNPENASREIHMLKSLDHPNIIKFYDAVEMWGNDRNGSIYLFMEYASGGDLYHYIKKKFISERHAKNLFRQILRGVEYLHSNDIAHRDLKPQNILLDLNKNVKIADFGLSKRTENGAKMVTRCGTPQYLAPEVFNRSISSYDGFKADMYSLGIILRDLVGLKYVKYKMPTGAVDLFKKLTSDIPSSRPSAFEALKDMWLNN